MSREYYTALVERNSQYEGIFWVGVLSTGIFCRPTCPARKPKYENCRWFTHRKDALLAGFRPCKRCVPLHSNLGIVEELVRAVEQAPEKRWKDHHLREMGYDPSTVRRHFKKRFKMTFIEFARSWRLGLALKDIRSGESVIDAQLNSGFESGSGFRDAFSRIMGQAPNKSRSIKAFKASWIETDLGPMIAIADETKLYLLEFVDRRGLEKELERLRKKTNGVILPGTTPPLISIEKELQEYFAGKRLSFTTPIATLGSPFQEQVWEELQKIPPGETISYKELAIRVGNPAACRAVARANGTNQLCLIIPCHRVINTGGKLGGYGGGIHRKKWLLEHEIGNK